MPKFTHPLNSVEGVFHVFEPRLRSSKSLFYNIGIVLLVAVDLVAWADPKSRTVRVTEFLASVLHGL